MIYEDFGGEITDYKQLFEKTIEDLCKKREEHNHTIAEAIVKQVELQPLKPDSVYLVKFHEGADLNHINEIIRLLTERTKDKNIVFIPSCDYFEIVGEVNETQT